MRKNPAAFDRRRESIRGIGLHVVVIGMHVCLWIIFVDGSAWPWQESRDKASRRHDVLDIRFIKILPRAAGAYRAMTVDSTPAVRPPQRRAPILTGAAANQPRSIAVVLPLPEPAAPAITMTGTTTTDRPSTGDIASRGYVSGGNLLNAASPTFATKVYLPGSATPRVAGITLQDRSSIKDTVHGLAKALGCSNLLFNMQNAGNPMTPQLMDRALQLEGCGPHIEATANDAKEDAIAHRATFGH